MNKIHAFEQSGLGKAPFSFDGWFEGNATPAPNMPKVTACDFCSTVIKSCFRIKSSDGKSFIVGSECVKKTGDKGLVKQVNWEVARQKRSKMWDKWQEVKKMIKGEAEMPQELKDKLSSQKHPYKSDMDMYDYAHYIAWHGGYDSSIKRVLKAIK